MELDPTINIGSLIQGAIMLCGILIALGMFKQRAVEMENKVSRVEEVVEKLETGLTNLTIQLSQFSVIQERLLSLDKRIDLQNEEMGRIRTRIHDFDRDVRQVQMLAYEKQ